MIKNMSRWQVISMATILISVAIVVVIRPQWGVDFTGGSLMEISTKGQSAVEIRETVGQKASIAATVQATEKDRVMIKMSPLNQSDRQRLTLVLEDEGILVEVLRFESIGPTIGQELRKKAVAAITVVILVLVVYLAYTFRQATDLMSSWKFGVAAVYALVHDLVFVLALFVILGKTMNISVDTLFVTAMLAILGYSVNDTIVVFNRLKSEYIKNRSAPLSDILDRAVKASLIRSLNTSLTTLLVLAALLIFGGVTIRWFIVALAAGTVVGTYSSLFVAPPFLHYLAKK